MRNPNFFRRRAPTLKNMIFVLAKEFDWRVLNYLIIIISVFVFVHAAAGAVLPKIPLIFNISHDGSIPEWFSYGMLVTSSIVLFRAFRRESSPLSISFAAVLLIILLDDSLQFHEVVGEMIAASLHQTSVLGLDPKDSGEMLAFAVLGLIAFLFVIYGAIQTPFSEWHNYFLLAALVALLGIFAVGIDLIHAPMCRSTAQVWRCFQMFDLLEDGGEMVCQAFIVAHVFSAFGLRHAPKINMQG